MVRTVSTTRSTYVKPNYDRYDHETDLTQGIRDFDHPEIVRSLEVWKRLDTGDPILWAKYKRGARGL